MMKEDRDDDHDDDDNGDDLWGEEKLRDTRLETRGRKNITLLFHSIFSRVWTLRGLFNESKEIFFEPTRFFSVVNKQYQRERMSDLRVLIIMHPFFLPSQKHQWVFGNVLLMWSFL